MKNTANFESFSNTLLKHELSLTRKEAVILQVNTGLLCNLACRHCHLSAGPHRKEIMSRETMDQVIQYSKANTFKTVDITGGAPELNPNIEYFVENIAKNTSRCIFRSNLIALDTNRKKNLIDVLANNNVAIVASFPSINENQTRSQRGDQVFKTTIEVIQYLNELGYGIPGSNLELNLVSNPTGAFLPANQEKSEHRFKEVLNRKWNISFNHLFSFANVPLGRFQDWLVKSKNYESYMVKLIDSFNPCAVDGLMCRQLISISWDGYLYDCDFNLAQDLPLGGKKNHITEMEKIPDPGTTIATANHCYSCTAGSGFT